MNLRPVDIRPEHDIAFACFTVPMPHSEHREVLVIKFTGTCGVGSDGNVDALFMTAMATAAIRFVEPGAVVYDLAGLRYEWGDRMSAVLESGGRFGAKTHLPSAVVVSELCQKAISSLLLQEMGEDLFALHTTLNGALAYLERES